MVERPDAVVHELHGARFHSYVSPSRGSAQLCAWRTELESRSAGTEHAVSHEEVFLVLGGRPVLLLDGTRRDLAPGDVVLVPAGSRVRLDNPGDDPAALWVTAPVGLTARTPDGTLITPPWAR